MANTTELKEVEKYLKALFLKEISANEICVKIPQFEPDIIAIKDDILVLGEISFSGYSGGIAGKAGYHTGGARKITDCYAKLDLLRRKKLFLQKIIPNKFEKIDIYFVTAKGTLYEPKGWKRELFSECDFFYHQVSVDEKTNAMIIKTIANSKSEFQK